MKATGSPHQVALGVAVGFFVGWLPIIGVQMAVAIVICSVIRCNRVVPLFPIWLTNPVTLVPVFSFNYYVGWLLFGGPDMAKVREAILRLKPPEENLPFFPNPFLWLWGWIKELILALEHVISSFWTLGWDMLLPLWFGSVIVGVILGAVSYVIVLNAAKKFRKLNSLPEVIKDESATEEDKKKDASEEEMRKQTSDSAAAVGETNR
jgi:uncharacterized protein (DUF2062 family)